MADAETPEAAVKAVSKAVELKALTEDTATVAGYGVVWGDMDLEGDTFTPETDLRLEYVPVKAVYYDHTKAVDEELGRITETKADDVGLWVKAELQRSRRYTEGVLKLIQTGALGWSSGSVPHLVRRGGGMLKRWPVVEFSLTPTPAEPRTLGVQRLKMLAAAYPELKALLDVETLTAGAAPDEPAIVSALTPDTAQPEPKPLPAGEPDHGGYKMADEQEVTTPVDVNAIVQQSVDAALKAYQAKLEAEPPLKQAAFKIPAEVREEEPLYKSFGTFMLDVAKSAQGPVNRRMEELKGADPLDENGYNVAKAMGQPFVGSVAQAAIKAPTGLNEGLGASGGFLVSQDRAASLIERMYDTGQVLSRVDMTGISANSNGMTFYAEDETSRADGSRRGGVLAYWASEGGSKTASQPKFREMELKLKKVVGLVYTTDELLADATALEGYIMRNLPEELRYKVEDSIFNGSGAGQPLGLLNAGALISVAKEVGQAADTVVFENIVKMYSRMWARSLPRAAWYISQNVWPQLYRMSLAVGTGGSAAYLPPNGLNAAPYGLLMGRPVLPVEYCDKLGDQGDIFFADLGEYQMIEKGGLQSASSIHVKFVTDETCYRFVYRVDGQPKWGAALTPKNGGDTVSPFITLDAR